MILDEKLSKFSSEALQAENICIITDVSKLYVSRCEYHQNLTLLGACRACVNEGVFFARIKKTIYSTPKQETLCIRVTS